MRKRKYFLARSRKAACRIRQLFLEPLEGRLLLATFIVNSTRDVANTGAACVLGTGECTLRGALQQADVNPGKDTITFDLAEGEPEIIVSRSLPSLGDVDLLGNLSDNPTGATRVELRGAPGNDFDGLVLSDGQALVRGFVIHGFNRNAIHVRGGSRHRIEGNLIGTNPSGSFANGLTATDGTQFGNGGAGVYIVAPAGNTFVGGTEADKRNVISGNLGGGVIIQGNSTGSVIQGNYIGTDVNGIIAIGNLVAGIQVAGFDNTIGSFGLASGGNVISGNGDLNGNSIETPGIRITGNNNDIMANFVGVKADGTGSVPNTGIGVEIRGADNRVGHGDAASESRPVTGNVIAGNGSDGVHIYSAGATGNLVAGNYIGLDVDQNSRGNSLSGVKVSSSAAGNRITGSTIAYNKEDGIRISNASNNLVSKNSTFANDGTAVTNLGNPRGVGIELANFGFPSPDVNDPGDADVDNSNRHQNWPEIEFVNVVPTNGDIQTRFRVDTLPTHAAFPLDIEFFVADGTGNDAEGKTYLGTVKYTEANAQSTITATFTPPRIIVDSDPIIATATDANGNTSEFSRPPIIPNAGVALIVNTLGDDSDADDGDGVCDVDIAEAGNQCTLRAALEVADEFDDLDRITFNIPVEVPTYQPRTALPEIRYPVSLDATTQPNGGRVVLDGVRAPDDTNGLHITAGDSSIKGFVVQRFKNGIVLSGKKGSEIKDSFIGTNYDGTSDRLGNDPQGKDRLGNREDGILITNSRVNFVQDNVISGNGHNGVEIAGEQAKDNWVQSNYIGTSANGMLDLGNSRNGITINDAPDNHIGGSENTRNYISGNAESGILISGTKARGNEVLGNYVGIKKNGIDPLLNDLGGIDIRSASRNVIGGTDAIARNVISSSFFGVRITGSNGADATENVIQGNFIGTNASGLGQPGNDGKHALGSPIGVWIENADNNVIGGSERTQEGFACLGACNVISGNGVYEFPFERPEGGVVIRNSMGTKIFNNNIGRDVSGILALGNANGIVVSDSDETVVAGNIISASQNAGVLINTDNGGSNANVIRGNLIGGSSVDDARPYANAYGVELFGTKNHLLENTVVGGIPAGDANTIVGNTRTGLNVGGNAQRNSFLKNLIYDNGDEDAGLPHGIALDWPDAVTINDPGDQDSGPNGLQNYPVITAASRQGGSLTVRGVLESKPSTWYSIEIYSNSECDVSGFGEGENYLGTRNIRTDGSGSQHFSFSGFSLINRAITATATEIDISGTGSVKYLDTSEFSKCFMTEIDSDGDGVSNREEDASGPDSNQDGILDSLQKSVAVLANVVTQAPIGVKAESGTLSEVAMLGTPRPDQLPLGLHMPLGTFSFKVEDLNTKPTAVVVTLPPGSTPQTWYKFSELFGWYEWLYDSTTGTGAEITPGSDEVILYFNDGERGDEDGLVNGEVFDPGGPAVFANSSLSGYVYADVDNNGEMDAWEQGIAGVPITLDGPVSMSVQTDVTGQYLFDQIPAGQYSVTQVQPPEFIDGAEVAGSPESGYVENNRFMEVDVGGGIAMTDYNFGERGLRPEFASLNSLLASADQPSRAGTPPQSSEIEVTMSIGKNVPIGATIDFGRVNQGGPVIRKNFVVTNRGLGPLHLGDLHLPFGYRVTDDLVPSLPYFNRSDVFTIQLDTTTAGVKNGTLSFSNNDPDESPYWFNITGEIMASVGGSGGGAIAPEIQITRLGNATDLFGGTIDFGTVKEGTTLVRQTFNVENKGFADLFVGDFRLPAGFRVVEDVSSVIRARRSDTFKIELRTTTPGTKSGRLSLPNSDADENPYYFTITGTVVARSQPVVADEAEGELSLYRTNLAHPSDVNNDGVTAPVDALLVINELNRGNAEVQGEDAAEFFFDTSGDGHLSALDALLVINELNRGTAPAIVAEGEAVVSMSDWHPPVIETELAVGSTVANSQQELDYVKTTVVMGPPLPLMYAQTAVRSEVAVDAIELEELLDNSSELESLLDDLASDVGRYDM